MKSVSVGRIPPSVAFSQLQASKDMLVELREIVRSVTYWLVVHRKHKWNQQVWHSL